MNGRQRLRIGRAALVAALAVAPGADAAPPPNDDLANATVISTLPFTDTVDNSEATSEAGEPSCFGPPPAGSVWWASTAEADGLLRPRTTGSSTSWTQLVVYRKVGEGLAGLARLVCAVNAGPPFEQRVAAGSTYLFQVATLDERGAVRFDLERVPPPANDAFADAIEVPSLPFGHAFSSGATTEPGEPTATHCGVVNESVWYSFTPSATGSDERVLRLVDHRLHGQHARRPHARCVPCLRPAGLSCAGGQAVLPAGRRLGSLRSAVVQPARVRHAERRVLVASVRPVELRHDPVLRFVVRSRRRLIASRSWTFRNGSTATGCCPAHRYAEDGDYTVRLEVRTADGRTAVGSRLISVQTHDVAIDYFSSPARGIVGKTKRFVVKVRSFRYSENVEVRLLKSNPALFGGFEEVAALTKPVPYPSDQPTGYSFDYTFTAADAALGRVTFKVTARPAARDAVPTDNEVVGPATEVRS
jgi:hypothetical protein